MVTKENKLLINRMNSRLFPIGLALVLIAKSGFAVDTNTVETNIFISFAGLARSETWSNISLVLFDKTRDHPNGPSIDDQINFGFITTTGMFSVYLMKPEYSCRISVVSESGKIVPRTRAGEKYGRSFDAVKKWDRGFLDMSGPNAQRRRPYWTLAQPDFPSVKKLPALRELFNFENPGAYEVTIEMQVFSHAFRESSTNAYLVKLPPVKLKVINTDETP